MNFCCGYVCVYHTTRMNFVLHDDNNNNDGGGAWEEWYVLWLRNKVERALNCEKRVQR